MRGSPKLIACILGLGALASAHDIPVDVTVQALVKPAGNRLHLLVRVPLQTMRDINVPLNAAGGLDLEQLRPMLPKAASSWISDFVRIDEDDETLPRPQVMATQISLPTDRSFASYEQAVAHATGPSLANDTNASWNTMFLDVLFDY